MLVGLGLGFMIYTPNRNGGSVVTVQRGGERMVESNKETF